ncbi:threonine dehydrogenase-like Zn-dependent dehydrogenase [Halorubrum alkaliphilum]|uniref:Glucose 1-dehydrogenase n=1 Tax=Halorubrum alkaliphilum TaxID=261290 RepID=A0A8T4GBW6_9EURY|nr:glucose 1-dehydrogenase [Halorubrum alkaliphilum]MBP1921918.1 threonine dehydrogenase-like Zn-dependent dehydrogenase [Halorubrum alkaliphilum]
MRAIVVTPETEVPHVREIARPEPAPGEALVRVLRVGIDGTDHEVIAGGHGGYPDGESHLVLGHEAIGVVEDPNGTDLDAGQLVVPTVRRPVQGGPTTYFERGEPDMAPEGHYVERGIAGEHGFMTEYVTSPAEFLVPVPPAFAETGFLIEPISNVEKALELARASRSAFEWAPESAMVLGNGSLGLLSVGLLDAAGFDRLYCLGRRDRPDPTIDVVERLGATYVDSREHSLREIPDVHEPMDLVIEATGHAPHAFETIDLLAPNGVGALLGIPGDDSVMLDGGRLHREFVLSNKALVGSVNSSVPHFRAALDTLAAFPDWLSEAVITDAFAPEAVESAFESDEGRIKSAIEFDTL